MCIKSKALITVLIIFLCSVLFAGCADTAAADADQPQPNGQVTTAPSLDGLRRTDEQKVRNAISGKLVSVLGDSISTFPGYSNNADHNKTIGENELWYRGTNYITDVNDTWWMQAINRTGTQLLVNNSRSGDYVTKRGVSRSLELDDNNDTPPDIIWVYLGTNDFRGGVDIGEFAKAYDQMILGMTEKYPAAEIYLFTIYFTADVHTGVNPNDVVYYNTVIEAIAEKYGLTVVDLYNDSGITKYAVAQNSCDSILHPNKQGMDKIADCLMNVLIERYAK